jgi:hypothetical protein
MFSLFLSRRQDGKCLQTHLENWQWHLLVIFAVKKEKRSIGVCNHEPSPDSREMDMFEKRHSRSCQI